MKTGSCHLADVCDKIEQWRDDYTGYRPHSSQGDLTPVEFAESCFASGQTMADLQQYSQEPNSVEKEVIAASTGVRYNSV